MYRKLHRSFGLSRQGDTSLHRRVDPTDGWMGTPFDNFEVKLKVSLCRIKLQSLPEVLSADGGFMAAHVL